MGADELYALSQFLVACRMSAERWGVGLVREGYEGEVHAVVNGQRGPVLDLSDWSAVRLDQ